MSQQALYTTIQQQIDESQNELDKILSKYNNNNNIDILKHLRLLHKVSNNLQNSVINEYTKNYYHSRKIKNF